MSSKAKPDFATGQRSNSASLTATRDLPDRPPWTAGELLRPTSPCGVSKRLIIATVRRSCCPSWPKYPNSYLKTTPITARSPCQRYPVNTVSTGSTYHQNIIIRYLSLPLRLRRRTDVKPPVLIDSSRDVKPSVLIDKRLLCLRLRLLPGDEYD